MTVLTKDPVHNFFMEEDFSKSLATEQKNVKNMPRTFATKPPAFMQDAFARRLEKKKTVFSCMKE